MSEMSDRVCDVLATRLQPALNGGPNITIRELAVAVLEGMKSPTQEMQDAGEAHCNDYGTPEGVWRDMIDAALKDTGLPAKDGQASVPAPPPALSPCVFECRAPDGSKPQGFGNGRAWCQVHGFDCPELVMMRNPESNLSRIAIKQQA